MIVVDENECEEEKNEGWRSIHTPLAAVNFIIILCTNFWYEHRFGSFFYIHVTREKLRKQHLYKKFACKMLMKLTPGLHQSWQVRCKTNENE